MKLLIVEDTQTLRDYLRRSLMQEGHAVESCDDGQQALIKARDNLYDTIILDLNIPKINGLEVIKALREHGIKTPIVILSAHTEDSYRVKGLDAGADDYMVKPFSYSELCARLRVVNRRQRGEPKKIITLGDLEINTLKRIVRFNEQLILLRPKEYSLMVCLAENKGEAISKDHILQRVWGINSLTASTRLRVCIKSLRSKIDESDDITQSIIKSVRGFGYIIE